MLKFKLLTVIGSEWARERYIIGYMQNSYTYMDIKKTIKPIIITPNMTALNKDESSVFSVNFFFAAIRIPLSSSIWMS